MEPQAKKFGDKLKELREREEMTQDQLAEHAGISLGALRDYEQDRKQPLLFTAFKIADALGVRVEIFKDTVFNPPENKRRRRRK